MRLVHFVIFFMAICSVASAQSIERAGKRGLGVSGRSGTDIMVDSKMLDVPNTGNASFKNYKDEELEEFSQKMKEREWGSEDTAWKRACEENTKQSYERYMAIYPNGDHISDAKCKLIDKSISEMLDKAHNDLPNIKQTESDEHSLTSTIVIENNTGLPLTIYYSGSDIKSILIPEGGKRVITVNNGDYKLAATVPPAHIRPYAGKTAFRGGRYEIGFWIVGGR